MPLSQKKQRAVDDAIRNAAQVILDEYAPEWREGTPETWNESTRRFFDMATEFEMKATAAVKAALSS